MKNEAGYLDKQGVIRRLRHYRFLKNQMMELLGGWVQSVPELDVKERFGWHIYADARHSDELRKRLVYLGVRNENRHAPTVSGAFLDFLAMVWRECVGTAQKIFVVDRLLREALRNELEEHLSMTSEPEDHATASILDLIRNDDAEISDWAEKRLAEFREGEDVTRAAEEKFRAAYAASGGFMMEGSAKAASVPKTFPYSTRPARPANYRVVERAEDYDAKEQIFRSDEGKRRLLHDLVDCEYITVERLGRMLAEFPDLPWDMRLQLSKQIWDEARHAETLTRRLKELGGKPGDYPVNYWGWEVDVNRPDPLERLALSNATFEREACKHLNRWIEMSRAGGDEESARVIEFILMDEVTHVQIGRHWVDALTEHDPERRARVLAYPSLVLDEAPRGVKIEDVS